MRLPSSLTRSLIPRKVPRPYNLSYSQVIHTAIVCLAAGSHASYVSWQRVWAEMQGQATVGMGRKGPQAIQDVPRHCLPSCWSRIIQQSSSTASCWFSRWVGILDHRTIHRTWQEHFEKSCRKANSFRTVLWPSDVSSNMPGKSTLSSLIFPAFSWRISPAMFDDSRCSASSSEYRSRKVLKPLGHGHLPFTKISWMFG